MRVNKDEAAALVIDIQEKLFPHMHEGERFLERVVIFIRGIKILDIPFLVTEQYRKGLGETIPQIKELVDNKTPLEKICFSCCDDSHIMTNLQKLNRKFVIIAGIEAHVCVMQTVMDLVENGFIPVVAEDCITSRKANDKKIALERIRNEGAIITTCESILLELCRVAGNEKFKAISALIK